MLLDSYQKGFLVGPNETEEEFSNRIRKTTELLLDPKFPELPCGTFSIISPSLLCLRSSKKLPFWFGGMTWICEIEKTIIPVLQLPKRMRFSWIQEAEVITHEQIHALRALFQEPKFEEILAYRTSRSPFRRNVGPLFQTDRESFLFLLCAVAGPFTLVPLMTISLLLFTRLILRQRTFAKALKRLSVVYKEPEKVIVCLTDQEILLYSKKKENLIDRSSLRWRQIQAVFS